MAGYAYGYDFALPTEGFNKQTVPITPNRTGRYQALELCVALWLNGALVSQPHNRSSLPNRDSNELNHIILKLLGASQRESADLLDMSCKQEVDLAALKCRLRHKAEERACHDSPVRDLEYEILCERRATLESLHYLQIDAYGQIRGMSG